MPTHENKLFVEQDGFLDLIDYLSKHNCLIRKHLAIERFISFSKRLEKNNYSNITFGIYEKIKYILRGNNIKAYTKLGKFFLRKSKVHMISQNFQEGHFRNCLNNFLDKII